MNKNSHGLSSIHTDKYGHQRGFLGMTEDSQHLPPQAWFPLLWLLTPTSLSSPGPGRRPGCAAFPPHIRSLHVSSPSCMAHYGGASAAAEAVSNLFRTSAPALTAGLFAPKVSSSPLVLPVSESSLLKADWMMAPPSFPSFLLTRGFAQPGPSHSPDAPPHQHTGARRTAVTAPGGHLGPWAFAHANGHAPHPLASSPVTFP